MFIDSADRAHYEAINAIYGHHVVTGFATFDEEAPALAERMDWFEQFVALVVCCTTTSSTESPQQGSAAS